MDLHDALTQISEIRRQVARTEVFRGYRAVPVAFSGFLAVAVAVYQAMALPKPSEDLGAYLMLWIGAAVLSMTVMGAALFLYWWNYPTPLTRTTTLLAVSQFTPAIVAGGVLAFVLWHQAQDALWMLPGLWSILFSLGIFASYRLLPRATFWIGVYYLAAGALCLAWAKGENEFSPWAMGVTFGAGQLLSAIILYWTLERPHGEEQ
ncbi:MAG: hypothetical protein HY040_27295 [Planctomycetes bacterium]|nr:hypothetical protein [Planctomycetota bacterium]